MFPTPVREVAMVKEAKRKDTTSYHKRCGEIKYISVFFQALFLSFLCSIFLKTYLKDTVYNAHLSSWVSAVEYNNKIISQNFHKKTHRKQTNKQNPSNISPSLLKRKLYMLFYIVSERAFSRCRPASKHRYYCSFRSLLFQGSWRLHNYILQEAKQFMKKKLHTVLLKI